MNKRIEWIDIAKFITIIMVIIAHSIINIEYKIIIYSFHVPLFFILSSMTFNYSKSSKDLLNNIKKSFKHLIIPIFIVTFIKIVLKTIIDVNFLTFENINYIILEMIAGSGEPIKIFGAIYSTFGPIWFLYALFWGRTLYDFIQLKQMGIHFLL